MVEHSLSIPDQGARRLSDHIVGRALPVGVRLGCYLGSPIEVGELATCAVMYFYPGCLCSPEDGYDSPGLDAAQHRAFSEHRGEFRGVKYLPIGVSTQSVEGQRRAVADTEARHVLLSDPGVRLARALGLATFNVDDADWYCRLTLLVMDGTISQVFSAGSNPEHGVASVLAWIREQRV
jgi:peroxiredoxin